MIYILTGIAKSGKTLLAKEIKKKYNISIFSTDYIMMMLHHGSNNINLDINASDTTVAKKLEPFIYGMIKTMIENNETYLIEGVHFNPDFSRRLIEDFKDKIKILYLGYKDISLDNKLKEILKYKNIMNNPWLFDHQGQPVEKIVEYMIKESKRVYTECVHHNLTYIDVYDINIQKEKIIDLLLGLTISN